MTVAEYWSQLAGFLTDQSAIARIVAFFIIWLILWLPISVPLATALKWHPLKPLSVEQKLPLVLSLYVLAPLVLWGAAEVQQISFSAYGLGWQPSILVSVALGLGFGVLGVALLFALESGLGWITWQKANVNQLVSTLPIAFLLGLLISIVEELVFRGFLINQLQQEYSQWGAAAISSLIFSLLHLVWEGKETAPQLPGLWLMGMVLVLARWVDGGSLGLAVGLHAGWILSMASLDTAQLICYSDRSPHWAIGLSGKPLAGAMGLLLLLVTAAALWVLAG